MPHLSDGPEPHVLVTTRGGKDFYVPKEVVEEQRLLLARITELEAHERLLTDRTLWQTVEERDAAYATIRELEDAILDWHREDRDGDDQDRASMRLYDVAEVIRKATGLDLGHAKNQG